MSSYSIDQVIFRGERSIFHRVEKTKYHRVPETIEITCACPDCAKTAKKIRRFFDGKSTISHEERLERLKKLGLPLVLETKN